ncbi:MAG: hypothetical protein N2515_07135, partial [Deltaproteobacteria bacterium]|nr:hypothetical protein [Deltaproteobacteria bacterium]
PSKNHLRRGPFGSSLFSPNQALSIFWEQIGFPPGPTVRLHSSPPNALFNSQLIGQDLALVSSSVSVWV